MLNILKAQYWPLCFAHLCCCFGFERSEASCYFKKSSILAAKKKPQNGFKHHRNDHQDIAACNAQWAIPGL